MMPVGREGEAPKVLAEEVMDPWPVAESAPLAARNGGIFSESAVPRGQCLPRASAHPADAGASENNTHAVHTSPSLSTLNGGGVENYDDNVLGSTTPAEAGSHPALGRFFFPKSASNISRSMDDAAWAGNAANRGRGGGSTDSPAAVAPSATVLKRLTRSNSSAGVASRGTPGGGGGIDPKSWSSTGGGGGVGDGRELDKKEPTTTPPSAPPPYARRANASAPSATAATAADGGGGGNGDFDDGGGGGHRRKDGDRRGSTGKRWIRRLLRTASSIGASSFGGGDSPIGSSDFESEDDGGKVEEEDEEERWGGRRREGGGAGGGDEEVGGRAAWQEAKVVDATAGDAETGGGRREVENVEAQVKRVVFVGLALVEGVGGGHEKEEEEVSLGGVFLLGWVEE